MGLSVTHLLLLLAVAFLLFGRGKISELLGDVGKGIRSFKKGLEENDETAKVDAAPESVKPAASGRSGLA